MTEIPRSVEFECALVITLQRGVLFRFFENAITHHQHIEFGAHESLECFLWCADDGFTAYVEACIDHDRAAGAVLEG